MKDNAVILAVLLVIIVVTLGRRPLTVETAVARSAADDGPVSVLDADLLARVFQIRTERLSHEGRSFFIPSGLNPGA